MKDIYNDLARCINVPTDLGGQWEHSVTICPYEVSSSYMCRFLMYSLHEEICFVDLLLHRRTATRLCVYARTKCCDKILSTYNSP